MNEAIDFIIGTIKGYYDKAHGIADTIINTLLLFEIVFFGLKMAMGEISSLAMIIKKILVIGAWLYIARNIEVLSYSFVRTLSQMAIRISFDSTTIDFLENPFVILDFAYHNILKIIIVKFSSLAKIRTIFKSLNLLVIVFLLIVLILGVGISFVIITLMVLLVQIEFYFIVLCAILLLPFMLNEKTQFISEKIIPSITGQGIKLMAITIVINVVLAGYHHVFDIFFENDTIEFLDMLYIATIVAMGLYLILQSYTFVQSIMSGIPDTNFTKQILSAAASGVGAYKIVSFAKQGAKSFDSEQHVQKMDLDKHLTKSSTRDKDDAKEK